MDMPTQLIEDVNNTTKKEYHVDFYHMRKRAK